MRQGPRRPAGILRHHLSAFPALGLAPGGKCYPGVWAPWQRRFPRDCGEGPGRCACSVLTHCVSGSPSLALRPAKETGGRGTVEAAEEPAPPGSRGNTTGDLQRAARSRWSVLSTPRQGLPGSPKESPLFRTGQGPPDLDCIKVRKCPTITRTNSSRRELQTVLGQSGSAVQVAKGGFLNGRDQGIDFRFWLAHWEPQGFTPLTY